MNVTVESTFFRRIREPLRQLHMQFPADDRL